MLFFWCSPLKCFLSSDVDISACGERQTHILETKHSRCICRAMQIVPQCENERIKEAQECVYTYNDGGKYVHLLSALSYGY